MIAGIVYAPNNFNLHSQGLTDILLKIHSERPRKGSLFFISVGLKDRVTPLCNQFSQLQGVYNQHLWTQQPKQSCVVCDW